MPTIVTVTITDPITDTELEFTGPTDADVDQQIDAHFGISHADEAFSATTPSTAAALHDAHQHQHTAEINYASTPEGLAEYTRRWELADTPTQRNHLATVIAAGVAAADEEYLHRLALNNSTLTDGLLRALLLPTTNDPTTNILAAQRIMGTYRQSDASLDTGTTRIAIHRLTNTGHRIRTTLTYPRTLLTTTTVTLTDVVSYAATRPEYDHRLRTLLTDSELNTIRTNP